jgi:hypothetical protein
MMYVMVNSTAVGFSKEQKRVRFATKHYDLIPRTKCYEALYQKACPIY